MLLSEMGLKCDLERKPKSAPGVPGKQRLEPRVAADRVPQRVKPQRVDADRGGLREPPLDLIERALGVAGLGQDLGAIFRRPSTEEEVLTVDLRLLQPTGLVQGLFPTAEPGQCETAGRMHPPIVGELRHHRIQERPR